MGLFGFTHQKALFEGVFVGFSRKQSQVGFLLFPWLGQELFWATEIFWEKAADLADLRAKAKKSGFFEKRVKDPWFCIRTYFSFLRPWESSSVFSKANPRRPVRPETVAR